MKNKEEIKKIIKDIKILTNDFNIQIKKLENLKDLSDKELLDAKKLRYQYNLFVLNLKEMEYYLSS